MFDRLLCSGSTTFGSLASVMLLLSPLAVILAFGPRPAEAQSPNTFVRQGVPITQQGILTENGEGSGSGAPDLQAKIKSAVSAGPSSISANATVKGHDGTVLREGTNGWTGYPDMPDRKEQNPMCLDREWVDWFEVFPKN